MEDIRYLKWLSEKTATSWWQDSADPDEIKESLANGATGVTTNPCLISASLKTKPEVWGNIMSKISGKVLLVDEKNGDYYEMKTSFKT